MHRPTVCQISLQYRCTAAEYIGRLQSVLFFKHDVVKKIDILKNKQVVINFWYLHNIWMLLYDYPRNRLRDCRRLYSRKINNIQYWPIL